MSQLVTDALALIAALDVEAITAAGGKAAEAVAILALVAGQDVEPAEGSDGTDGRWRIARKVAPDRVISTVDPESRHTRKSRENRQEGFKAHLVVEPDTGLTTAAALTKTNGPDNSDATIGGQLLDADPTMPARDRARREEPATPTRARPDEDELVRRSGPRCSVIRPTAPATCWTRSTKRVEGDDQAAPVAARGRGRVHVGRLRLRRAGRHCDLPEPGHPPAVEDPDRDVRRSVVIVRSGSSAPPP